MIACFAKGALTIGMGLTWAAVPFLLRHSLRQIRAYNTSRYFNCPPLKLAAAEVGDSVDLAPPWYADADFKAESPWTSLTKVDFRDEWCATGLLMGASEDPFGCLLPSWEPSCLGLPVHGAACLEIDFASFMLTIFLNAEAPFFCCACIVACTG